MRATLCGWRLLGLLRPNGGLGRETGFIDMLISVALSSAIALPIDLIGLFIAGSVLGTGFGSFRSAVVRLAAIIVLLQGLCWILFLSYVSTESIYVLAGGGLLVCLLSVGLMMECFDLLIFETIVCLVILGATESAAAALVKWLLASGIIQLGGSPDPITALSLLLAQQLSF